LRVACFWAYFVTAAYFLGLYVRRTFKLVISADVERVFSQVNIIKSKTRNRMISSTLSGILHVRYGMKRQGICCTQFTPTSDMLKGEAIQCIEIVAMIAMTAIS